MTIEHMPQKHPTQWEQALYTNSLQSLVGSCWERGVVMNSLYFPMPCIELTPIDKRSPQTKRYRGWLLEIGLHSKGIGEVYCSQPWLHPLHDGLWSFSLMLKHQTQWLTSAFRKKLGTVSTKYLYIRQCARCLLFAPPNKLIGRYCDDREVNWPSQSEQFLQSPATYKAGTQPRVHGHNLCLCGQYRMPALSHSLLQVPVPPIVLLEGTLRFL